MRLQIGRIFDDEKRLLLLETGIQTIEDLLKQEVNKVQADLQQKKSKVEELKAKSGESASKIRSANIEILSRPILQSIGR